MEDEATFNAIQEPPMPILGQSLGEETASGRFADAFRALVDEACMLAEALLSPRRIIEDVEQMRALQVAADTIEATDPWRADVLRSRASRIGLR
jgi:ketopantoate reductase